MDRVTMPAISITDDQRERLRWIQARLGDDVEYGHVRPRDALEFLLDRFDETGELSSATGTAPEETTSGAASESESESDSESESASRTTSADTTGRIGRTDGFVVMNGGDVAASGGAADRGDDDRAAASADADAEDDAVETAEDATGDESAAASDSSETAGDEADGETRLNSVMSLLDDHDGRWRETGGGEEKYEVDLPDGGTERARTKDDVRAVLFRHYR
jgi:hypothetical protein